MLLRHLMMHPLRTRAAAVLRPSPPPLLRRTTTAASSSTPSRRFPDAPRVGVGVCLLRAKPKAARPPDVASDPVGAVEALLIRRSKPPGAGIWSFPGGGLRLGETLVACAERELLEETGLRFDTNILTPEPFASFDNIVHTRDNDATRVEYHYVIVEVVGASTRDDTARGIAMDDASDLAWHDAHEIANMEAEGRATAPVADYVAQCAKRFAAHIIRAEDAGHLRMRTPSPQAKL